MYLTWAYSSTRTRAICPNGLVHLTAPHRTAPHRTAPHPLETYEYVPLRGERGRGVHLFMPKMRRLFFVVVAFFAFFAWERDIGFRTYRNWDLIKE